MRFKSLRLEDGFRSSFFNCFYNYFRVRFLLTGSVFEAIKVSAAQSEAFAA